MKKVVLSYQLIRQLRIKEAISNIKNKDGEITNQISLNEDEKQILIEVSKGKTNKRAC